MVVIDITTPDSLSITSLGLNSDVIAYSGYILNSGYYTFLITDTLI